MIFKITVNFYMLLLNNIGNGILLKIKTQLVKLDL